MNRWLKYPACPKCKVEPGEHCINTGRKLYRVELMVPHKERRKPKSVYNHNLDSESKGDKNGV